MTTKPQRQSAEVPAAGARVTLPKPPPSPYTRTEREREELLSQPDADAGEPLERAPEPTPEAPDVEAPTPARPPMPPKRQRTVRVQFTTRIRTDLDERLRRFIKQSDASMQDVAEMALGEFLDRRGG